MSRRFLFLLIVVILVGIGTTVFAAEFADVQGTAYEPAFHYLSSRKVVRGYSDSTGRPWSTLNRVEAVKVILEGQQHLAERVAWYQKHTPPLPLFSDVRQSEWYVPYLETAFEKGIIRGYPDGTFRPGQSLTVEEAVTLLMRAYGERGTSEYVQSPYIENRSGDWYSPAVSRAIKKNLVMHQGVMKLGATITRGQFFDMVYRFMVIEEEGLVAYAGPEPEARAISPTTQIGRVPSRTVVHTRSRPTVTTGTNTLSQVTNHPYASEQFFAISMPSLGVEDLAVNHPMDPFSSNGVLEPLKNGVGHLFSYPGGGGKIMIYGHSSSYAWDVSPYTKIFRKVNELNPGDRVYITYDGKLHTYEVTFEETVPASDTTPFNDKGESEELILYTCWPPDSIAERYLVHARYVETLALR